MYEPSAGLTEVSTGALVSTVTERLAGAPALPYASTAVTLNVCEPSPVTVTLALHAPLVASAGPEASSVVPSSIFTTAPFSAVPPRATVALDVVRPSLSGVVIAGAAGGVASLVAAALSAPLSLPAASRTSTD